MTTTLPVPLRLPLITSSKPAKFNLDATLKEKKQLE